MAESTTMGGMQNFEKVEVDTLKYHFETMITIYAFRAQNFINKLVNAEVKAEKLCSKLGKRLTRNLQRLPKMRVEPTNQKRLYSKSSITFNFHHVSLNKFYL